MKAASQTMTAAMLLALSAAPAAGAFPGLDGPLPAIDGAPLADGLPMRGGPADVMGLQAPAPAADSAARLAHHQRAALDLPDYRPAGLRGRRLGIARTELERMQPSRMDVQGRPRESLPRDATARRSAVAPAPEMLEAGPPPAQQTQSAQPDQPAQRLRDVDFSGLMSALGLAGGEPAAEGGGDGRPLRLGDLDLSSALPGGGGFEPRFSAELTGTYDDNIRARETDQESDLFADLAPEVELRSQWANHALNLGGGLRHRRHLSLSREDRTDFHAGLDGRLDIRRDTRLHGRLRHLREHQPRTDAEERGGLEPTPIRRLQAEVLGEQEFASLVLALRGRYESFVFGDVPADDGSIIRNDDRDRVETEVAGRATLPLTPDLGIYLEGSTAARDFERAEEITGIDRDTQVYEGILGFDFVLRGFRDGELYFGLRRQAFDDPALGDAGGFIGGMRLGADLTEATSVTVEGTRKLEATTVLGAGSVEATTLDAQLEHAASRGATFGAALRLSRETFVDIAREDLLLGFGADAAYEINPNLRLVLDAAITSRDSNLGPEFRRNRVTFGMEVDY